MKRVSLVTVPNTPDGPATDRLRHAWRDGRTHHGVEPTSPHGPHERRERREQTAFAVARKKTYLISLS